MKSFGKTGSMSNKNVLYSNRIVYNNLLCALCPNKSISVKGRTERDTSRVAAREVFTMRIMLFFTFIGVEEFA
jgi:hypothetical protein